MPGTYLGYPFNEELFLYQWENEKDPTLTALFDSGAVVADGTIKQLISNGSDIYTIPFYKTIGGTPDNYDGSENITLTDPTGGSQSGVVYGRGHGWKDKDFVLDYNSGADPMKQISSQVAKYWQKARQTILLAILKGIYNIADPGDAGAGTAAWNEWGNHTYTIASGDSSLADSNKVGATTAGDAVQKAVGDAMNEFTLAVMHSKVATNLAGLQLLNYRKYTDAQGIERIMRIADYNGMTVLVDDGVPVAPGTPAGSKEYTTYLFGTGAIRFAPASVKNPVEITRDALTGGGYDALVTRIRETLHPNGFSFVKPGSDASPTNDQLGANANNNANWKIAVNPKNIAIARIISNG